MSVPCPKCGRLHTFDGARCCNKYCRFGSNQEPETDFKEVRRQRFLSGGGSPATATWTPAWYELDPPLFEVGLTTEFAFCRVPHGERRRNEGLVFHTGLSGDGFDVAWGTIAAIHHTVLGEIRSISTRGLCYSILLENGKQYEVEAEETPGELYEKHFEGWAQASPRISNWRFTIKFEALAEREPVEPT